MGLFSLSSDAYFRLLPMFEREVTKGANTKERNFLPFIPWLRGRGRVLLFSALDEIEALGINTPDDLQFFETHLKHP